MCRMPWNSDPTMQALRLTYNAAVAAHAACARALSEAVLRGDQPTPDLVKAEARAKARLSEARERLHTAMAAAMGAGGTATPTFPGK